MLMVICLRKSYELICSFPVSCVKEYSRNGGERRAGGWELARLLLWTSGKASTLFSECCEIDTQQTPSTSLFQVTYTLLKLQEIPCFLGFPGPTH